MSWLSVTVSHACAAQEPPPPAGRLGGGGVDTALCPLASLLPEPPWGCLPLKWEAAEGWGRPVLRLPPDASPTCGQQPLLRARVAPRASSPFPQLGGGGWGRAQPAGEPDDFLPSPSAHHSFLLRVAAGVRRGRR